jgi:hypothetical protein
MKTITQEEALNILISAVQVATKRGAYELSETETILQSVKVFTTTQNITPEAPQPSTEVVETVSKKHTK